ncbi:hypothetical protein ACSBLW_03805 [Thioclava sp. FR2]|uniref:hypothetical protein n=1 Tax=Thioclava sp. FR2 TaxID=3445780 RepID=UPI003EC07B0B
MTDGAPFPQHWAYSVAMERMGAEVSRLLLAGRPVQALERPGLRLIHRLPPDLSLCSLARHAGLTVISTTSSRTRLIPLITARHHAIWDIDAPLPTLLARMRQTWRQALEKAVSPVRVDNPPCSPSCITRGCRAGRGAIATCPLPLCRIGPAASWCWPRVGR